MPDTDTQEWRLGRVDQGRPFQRTISHGWAVTAPGCPDGRHPTRDCGCHLFKTHAEAEEYINEQKGVRRG